jgi:hypothetical protein
VVQPGSHAGTKEVALEVVIIHMKDDGTWLVRDDKDFKLYYFDSDSPYRKVGWAELRSYLSPLDTVEVDPLDLREV